MVLMVMTLMTTNLLPSLQMHNNTFDQIQKSLEDYL